MTTGTCKLNICQSSIFTVHENVIDLHVPPLLPSRNHQLQTRTNRNIILEVQTFHNANAVCCIALNAARRLGCSALILYPN